MTTYMTAMASELQSQVTTALQQSMNQMANNMASAMSIDPDKFKDAFQMNMTEEDLGELMMSLMNTEEASYDNNLKKLGYADPNKPGGIDIYPIDFESKEKVIGILDGYNDRMTADGQEDKVITYTDFVGTLMSSVTDIVNMISYVLVAFVAISLVVSSIMIGVITYISVLERKKEIGILRSIGASKGDIGRVFNAEDHHRGLHRRTDRRGRDRALLHPCEHHHLFVVRRGRRGLTTVAGRRNPRGHQRAAHVPSRPHPLERRQPQGSCGGVAQRIAGATAFLQIATARLVARAASSLWPRLSSKDSARAQSASTQTRSP